jgi:hypothetical protein
VRLELLALLVHKGSKVFKVRLELLALLVHKGSKVFKVRLELLALLVQMVEQFLMGQVRLHHKDKLETSSLIQQTIDSTDQKHLRVGALV